MTRLYIWAFLAGLFNGVLMRIYDFIREHGG